MITSLGTESYQLNPKSATHWPTFVAVVVTIVFLTTIIIAYPFELLSLKFNWGGALPKDAITSDKIAVLGGTMFALWCLVGWTIKNKATGVTLIDNPPSVDQKQPVS